MAASIRGGPVSAALEAVKDQAWKKRRIFSRRRPDADR
jgi:hypothetical protein